MSDDPNDQQPRGKRGGYPRDPERRPGKKNASKRSAKKAGAKKRGNASRQQRARKPFDHDTDANREQSAMPNERQLAKAIITGKPPKRPGSRATNRGPDRKNIRPGRGDATGPFTKPPLRVFTTTLWDYPSQHYGDRVQGEKNFIGATPSWVVWQLIQRYTQPGDLVVDPMAGSGTTLDVARDTEREAACFDLAPTRPDVHTADARELPLDDGVARLLFVDPPYSTHIEYSDDPRCIGTLDAAQKPQKGRRGNAYFDAMADVFAEADRVLAPGGVIAIYVSDSFDIKRGFVPIGFELFALLRERFEPIDVAAVVRRNEKLNRGNFHKAAEEQNFFLRGFNYCLIFRKIGRSTRRAPKQAQRRPTKTGVSTGTGGRVAGRNTFQQRIAGPVKPKRPSPPRSKPGKRTANRAGNNAKAPRTSKRPANRPATSQGPPSEAPPPKRKPPRPKPAPDSPLGPRARRTRPGDSDKPGSL